jgi:uncharacterized membrane protein YoaT (DUF817 family)
MNPPTLLEIQRCAWLLTRSCIFAGAFFAILALSKAFDTQFWLGLYRYDFILLLTLVLQAVLVWRKVETWQELRAISYFHVLGFALEVFKTSPEIGSWSYPEPGLAKLFNVPLYSGFMYAAVASFMMQAWRQFNIRLSGQPPLWAGLGIASAIYVNFFTHHAPLIPDFRWLLAVILAIVYWRCNLHFSALDVRRALPMVAAFIALGLLVWVAENLSTFLGAWKYPNQIKAWSMVHFGKIGAWTLLVVMTFVIVSHSGAVDRRPEGITSA